MTPRPLRRAPSSRPAYLDDLPVASGLYDPRFEHDACGVGMVARLDNEPTHEVITKAITALENLEHRGATGADRDRGLDDLAHMRSPLAGIAVEQLRGRVPPHDERGRGPLCGRREAGRSRARSP